MVLPSHWMIKEMIIDTNFSISARKANLATIMAKNVERFFIDCANLIVILPLVHHSAKVREIGIEYFPDLFKDKSFVIDVAALNKEREKLDGACKQIIYVPEQIVLNTKWAGMATTCSLIRLKPLEACKWKPELY